MLKDNGLYKLNVAEFGKSKSKLTVDLVVNLSCFLVDIVLK